MDFCDIILHLWFHKFSSGLSWGPLSLDARLKTPSPCWVFWTWPVQYYTCHFEFGHLWYPPISHRLLPLKLRQDGWIGICPYILMEVWRDNGQCFFPYSNISGHNSVGPIIITDVILKESFAFIPSSSHDPKYLSQVWGIYKWNHLMLPVSVSHFGIGWHVGPDFACRVRGLVCVWQRVIVVEYHHILEGCLRSLYPVLTALYTDEHCTSFHPTQLVHSLSFYAGVYASSNGTFDWISFHIPDMDKCVPYP